MKTLAFIAGGVAAGILIDRLIIAMNTSQKERRYKLLEGTFGSTIHANTFELSDVRDWFKSRKESLASGNKGLVMKINDETLKSLGKNLNLGRTISNMLAMAIINTETNEIVDSTLAKYDRIDDKLENALAKGNGIMVIEE